MATTGGGVLMTTLMACYGDAYNDQCDYTSADQDGDCVEQPYDCNDQDPSVSTGYGCPNVVGPNRCVASVSDADGDCVEVGDDCNDLDPTVGQCSPDQNNNDNNDPGRDCAELCGARSERDVCAVSLDQGNESCERICDTLSRQGSDREDAVARCLESESLCQQTIVECVFDEVYPDPTTVRAMVYGTGFDTVPDGAPAAMAVNLDGGQPQAVGYGTVDDGVLAMGVDYTGPANQAPYIHWFIDADGDNACTDDVDLAGAGLAVPLWSLPIGATPTWHYLTPAYVLLVAPTATESCAVLEPDHRPDCVDDGDCVDGTCDEGTCQPNDQTCPDGCDAGSTCIQGECVELEPGTCTCDADCLPGQTCTPGGLCEGEPVEPDTTVCQFDNQCGATGACFDQRCTTRCQDDGECPRTMACVDGLCQAGPGGDECVFNNECGAGVCVNAYCLDRCCEDAQCEGGFFCDRGICRPDGRPSFQCTRSSDCDNGATCVNAVCRNSCFEDGDCPGNESCNSGFCLPANELSPQCRASADCDEGAACINGLCQ